MHIHECLKQSHERIVVKDPMPLKMPGAATGTDVRRSPDSAAQPAATDRLLQPVELGSLRLPNRIVMSPMTRMRVDGDLAPLQVVADYYSQRASAGLIVTESIAAAAYGAGFPPLPVLVDDRQADAWRDVVAAVHRSGGRIAAQLWHVGRAQDASAGHGRPPGWAVTDQIRPDELRDEDIATIAHDFSVAATLALDVGFDAVEVHAGSANLLDRFLRQSTNARRDGYGGSAERRSRLLLEIIRATVSACRADRVGLKLSPSATVAGGPDAGAAETFGDLLERLSPLGLAWLHVTRPTVEDRAAGSGPGLGFRWIAERYSGALIGAGSLTRDEGEAALAAGFLDAVVYGRAFLANPDLPARFARRAALNSPDTSTFYTPGPEGLIDYPSLP
jgi:N-ethylmaleimide reductase